jgi:hypothetical protein
MGKQRGLKEKEMPTQFRYEKIICNEIIQKNPKQTGR